MTSLSHRSWFTGLKYLVYLLLMVNVGLFLQEELLAFEHTFSAGMAPGDLIQVFSATIDTAAWVILLLLFELETSVISDERINGWVKWSLHGVRGVCYLFIVYAFYGYLIELHTLYQIETLAVDNACALLGESWSVLMDLDEYVVLGADNCAALGPEVLRVQGFAIVADPATLLASQYLAWTDLINSAAWILVVIVLEIDVLLQLRGQLQGRAVVMGKIAKAVLYSLLLVAALYWGFNGDFLDFWDAFLWLFAFIFIELNVFDWQAETDAATSLD